MNYIGKNIWKSIFSRFSKKLMKKIWNFQTIEKNSIYQKNIESTDANIVKENCTLNIFVETYFNTKIKNLHRFLMSFKIYILKLHLKLVRHFPLEFSKQNFFPHFYRVNQWQAWCVAKKKVVVEFLIVWAWHTFLSPKSEPTRSKSRRLYVL